MKYFTSVIALFFMGISTALAQREANIWYFGNEAGLDFNKTPVSVLSNGKISKGGSSSICNSKGRLLFYSDGYNIYDSTHKIMPNGHSQRINSNWVATQSALIVPWPGNKNMYYLFTNELTPDTVFSYARSFLCYSVIDMRLNGGKGDVVKGKRNIVILDKTTQMLAATQHANGSDYWILTHKTHWDASGDTYYSQSDSIYAWLLSPQGLNPKPVISKTGRKARVFYNYFMKLSPDGKKLAYNNFSELSKPGIPSDSVQLADFDINTGKVTNLKAICFATAGNYSLEFSPNGRYLYLIRQYKGMIYQFNALAKTSGELMSSKVLIDSTGINGSSVLQLAPNGVIYVTRGGNINPPQTDYLDAILAPDSAGTKCKLTKKHIYLEGKTGWGLPLYVSSFLRPVPPSILYSTSCKGDTAFFSIRSQHDADSLIWDMGDSGSGTNISRSTEPYHIYNKQGTYTVKVVLYDENKTDTLTSQVNINGAKADFNVDDVCASDTVKFINTSGFGSERNYTWKFGDGTTDQIKNPKHYYEINGVTQTYNVTLVSSMGDGCKDSITKAVTVNANPISDFTFTASGKDYNFEATQLGNTKYRWLFGDGDSSAMAKPSHTYTDLLTMHTVCLKVTNVANCVSESCKQINTAAIATPKPSGFTIYPNPNNGSFTIGLTNPEKDADIEVYDLLGKLVKKVERVGKVTLLDLDVESGIYLVKVKNGDISKNQKVFVLFNTNAN